MKHQLTRMLAMALCLVMLLSLAACGKQKDTLAEYLEQNGMTQDQLDATVAAAASPSPSATPASSNTVTTPPPTLTPVATATPVPTATVAPTATPAPTASPAPTAAKNPTITKSPTSETLTEGGNAIFIAYATDYQYISWRLVSADGSQIILMNQAPYTFTGLSVTGDGTSTLTLCNCPKSLSGWTVDAVFTGNGVSVATNRATITVNAAQKVQLYANPSAGYFQFCDESIYIYGPSGSQYYYEISREGNYGRAYYASGTKNSGDPIYLSCENGVCYTYYVYANVIGDESNAISCTYTVDGTQAVSETVYATDGYDNAGYTHRYVSQSGWYTFSARCDNLETFDIYILNSEFTDGDRYISQAYTPSLTLYATSSGGLYLNAGQYVYVYCDKNNFTGDRPASTSYVCWSMG